MGASNKIGCYFVSVTIVTICAAICSASFMLYANTKLQLPILYLAICFACSFCGVVLGLIPPAMISTLILFSHLSTTMEKHILNFINTMKEKSKLKRDRENMLATGFDIFDLLYEFEESFGVYLFIEVGYCIAYLVIGIFFSFGIAGALSTEKGWLNSRLFMAANHICCTIISLIKILLLLSHGQKLTIYMKKTKKMLETVYMENMEYFDESTTARMNILIDNFATISPIRPLDSFNLNWSTGIAACGVLMTYIVVLLQFRISDTSI
jgi:hypothetical protein